MKNLTLLSFLSLVIVCSFVFGNPSKLTYRSGEDMSVSDILVEYFPDFHHNLEEVDEYLWHSIKNSTGRPVTVFAYEQDVNASSFAYQVTFANVSDYENLFEPVTAFSNFTLYYTSDNTTVIDHREYQVWSFYDDKGIKKINPSISNVVIYGNITGTNGVVFNVSGPIPYPQTSVTEMVTPSNTTFGKLSQRLNTSIDFSFSTVFVPTESAFNNLYAANPILSNFFSSSLPQVQDAISFVLKSHTFKSSFIYPSQIQNKTYVNQAGYSALFETVFDDHHVTFMTVQIANTTLPIANVTVPNILASDGVVHEIDTVIAATEFLNITLSNVFELTTDVTSGFVSAVYNESLSSLLVESNPRTFFIPTNEAFKNPVDITSDVLLYHVVEGNNLPFNGIARYTLLNASETNSTQAGVVYLTTVNNTKYINGIPVQGSVPYTTSMGTQVYLIPRVIGLPKPAVDTLPKANFSEFLGLLGEKIDSNIVDLNTLDITILAPTNQAIMDLPLGMVGYWRLNISDPDYSQVINNHVLRDAPVYNFRAGVHDYTAYSGQTVTIDNSGSGPLSTASDEVIINGYSKVVSGPFLTATGVAYGVDAVLLPSGYSLNVGQILNGFNGEDDKNAYGTYNTFLNAVNKVGLQDVLSDPRVTLFVPTDTAFSNMEENINDLINQNKIDEVRTILNYHISYQPTPMGLNQSQVFSVGNTTGNTIIVLEAGPKPLIELRLSANETSGTAYVIMNTTASAASTIYGIDKVLGVTSRDGSGSSGKLKTWQIVLIVLGGILLGLLILAAIVTAVWYFFFRQPNTYVQLNQ